MAECRIQFLGHCDLDLCPSFLNNRVLSITLILFELGIQRFGVWMDLGGVSHTILFSL